MDELNAAEANHIILNKLNPSVKEGYKPTDCKDLGQNIDFQTEIVSELKSTISKKDEEINNLTNNIEKIKRQLLQAHGYNEDLRQEISKLSTQLHYYRNVTSKAVFTQVCEAEIEEAYGIKPMPEWGTDFYQHNQMSIAESVKAVVEDRLQKQLQENLESQQPPLVLSGNEVHKSDATSEYVYDASSGLYYHPATGYYWDPNSGLLYDYTSGTYYKYDEQTRNYEVHSRVDPTGQRDLKVKKDKRKHKYQYQELAGKRYQKRKLKKISSNRKTKLASGSGKSKHNQIVRKMEDSKTDMKIRKEVAVIDACRNLENEEPKYLCVAESSGGQMVESVNTEEAEMDSECESNESSGSLATDESELVSELESGELSSSDTESPSSSDVETPTQAVYSSGPVASENLPTDEMLENHPPCIRMIVLESGNLCLGSLYIVTCAGGTIGRKPGKGLAVEIDDINVSKVHAQIDYNVERNCYVLTDKGSQNGSILNDTRLSKSKSKSSQQSLQHEDILQIGSTKFLLHIHKGHETCEDCEPGQVQAKLKSLNPIKNNYVVLTQEEKNQQRKEELKNIKKKYGLQNSQFESASVATANPNYCDKAYLRRKFIGSETDVHKQDESPASVQSPISASNKGHKLLTKMGWKEGQGLGKSNLGISEPINVEMRMDQNAGLGSRAGVFLSLDNVEHAEKVKRWSKAHQRYLKLQEDANRGRTGAENHSQSIPSYQTSTISSADSLSHHDCHLLQDKTALPSTHVTPSENVHPNLEQHSKTSKSETAWIKGGVEQIGQCVPDLFSEKTADFSETPDRSVT